MSSEWHYPLEVEQVARIRQQVPGKLTGLLVQRLALGLGHEKALHVEAYHDPAEAVMQGVAITPSRLVRSMQSVEGFIGVDGGPSGSTTVVPLADVRVGEIDARWNHLDEEAPGHTRPTIVRISLVLRTVAHSDALPLTLPLRPHGTLDPAALQLLVRAG